MTPLGLFKQAGYVQFSTWRALVFVDEYEKFKKKKTGSIDCSDISRIGWLLFYAKAFDYG